MDRRARVLIYQIIYTMIRYIYLHIYKHTYAWQSTTTTIFVRTCPSIYLYNSVRNNDIHTKRKKNEQKGGRLVVVTALCYTLLSSRDHKTSSNLTQSSPSPLSFLFSSSHLLFRSLLTYRKGLTMSVIKQGEDLSSNEKVR